ncbi:deoxyribose-phosphate aldolase [Halosimplex sp. J119]
MNTDAAEVTGRIEHTVLGPETTPDDVIAVLDAAIEYGMRACIPPCYLELAAGYAPSVPLSTVIGFPHGQHTIATKVAEATDAWDEGADELDMVINVGRLRAGEHETVTEEIEEVVAAVPIPVKVIVETPLLADEAEKRRAAECALEADADYLKTATGFSDGGATVPDVELLAEYMPVKASGGVGSWADMEAMLDAGAERIGASSGDVIAREFLDQHETATREDVSGWE